MRGLSVAIEFLQIGAGEGDDQPPFISPLGAVRPKFADVITHLIEHGTNLVCL